jgi:hypothetical protein
MADRNLADLIRFLDPSGQISDADVAAITKKLKFTDVLDLVGAMGKGDEEAGRNILVNYDPRFTVAKEYSSMPGANKPASGFKKIAPQGTVGTLPTTGGASGQQPPNATTQTSTAPGQQDAQQDLDQIISDPQTKNSPEVRQIQNLLQRLQQK